MKRKEEQRMCGWPKREKRYFELSGREQMG